MQPERCWNYWKENIAKLRLNILNTSQTTLSANPIKQDKLDKGYFFQLLEEVF